MLKKLHFKEGEISIYDEAVIYQRGAYWQFRMWLPNENKDGLRMLVAQLKRKFSRQCRSRHISCL